MLVHSFAKLNIS